jgi:pyruvate/2-oxoglutarate dehydrogenase complex dihydrolipoamide acyltransferase (E2) component
MVDAVSVNLGMNSDVTKHAQLVAEVCEQEIAKIETELEQLEAEINPALDNNALVAFSYVLGKVVDAMKQVPEVSVNSWGQSGGKQGTHLLWWEGLWWEGRVGTSCGGCTEVGREPKLPANLCTSW